MLSHLTPRECAGVAITALDKILNLGTCYPCALKIVADRYRLDLDRLDDLWLDAKRQKINDAGSAATA